METINFRNRYAPSSAPSSTKIAATWLFYAMMSSLMILVTHAQNRLSNGFPNLPVIEALDTNKDGEVSKSEWEKAAEALLTLDKNGDGELDGTEIRPTFPQGGFRRQRGGGPGGFGGDGGATRMLRPEELEFKDGVPAIPDHETYRKLSYKGEEVLVDTFLAGLEFVKFTLDGVGTDDQRLYFINTNTHRGHPFFARAVGLPGGRGGSGNQMKGVLVFRPMLKSPSGKPGLYTYEFEPNDAYSADQLLTAEEALIEKMPILEGNIGYYPRGTNALRVYEDEKRLFELLDIKVYMDEQLTSTEMGFLPLNHGVGFGRLRHMEGEGFPSPRDVVIYDSLPNEMPRVAGIITSVRQTPLSHVNLRAVQDKVPNAYIDDAAQDPLIRSLIGKTVAYSVNDEGYSIREATAAELEAHYQHIRPSTTQHPERDLSVKEIRSLDQIRFEDAKAFGVKTANVATLGSFGFPQSVVPKGYGIPFSFYDAFMKHNGFYDQAKKWINDPSIVQDVEKRKQALENFRASIREGEMPDWIQDALSSIHSTFENGQPIRCRSSTNNEDLPGFSGAGLYDSCTHREDEGQLAESIKQVYASLWNDRAFEEREFYRIDHLETAMGVLLHRNYENERANGVAVTSDILYQTEGNYYINTQVGEDLVTNPEATSIPEELLVDWWDVHRQRLMSASNRLKPGERLIPDVLLKQLQNHLSMIHARFAKLYGKSLEDEKFAMEIEFKITEQGDLAIKQARPWIFAK